MVYTITLQRQLNGGYLAVAPLLPGLTRIGSNREAALQAMREALLEASRKIEVVQLDLSTETEMNPWLETFGSFADDETLLPMLEEIYRARDEE